MSLLQLAVLLSLGVVQSATTTNVWHLVNATAAVCPGQTGDVLTVTEPSKLHSPHVFTIFRTTSQPVTIAFKVTDADGKIIADELGGVTLLGVTSSRRLDKDAGEAEEASPRQLAARRRSGSYSSRTYSSPRRRTSYSSPRRRTSYSSPRRRTSYSPPRRRTSSYSPPRRRAASYVSPRRRGYTSSGPRRRSYGYDNKHYYNPYNSGVGSYGFTSPAYASSLYGGRPPMSSPYGYYGANAYSGAGGSGAMIALAAGGGLLAGIAGTSLYHHWSGYNQAQLMNMNCLHGSWTGLCSTCVTMYQAANCNLQFAPKINANRDDLMNTGFFPADFKWPIHVNITDITGADYDPNKICPPNSPSQQLFLTITAVDELSSNGATGTGRSADSGHDTFWSYFQQVLIGLVAVCCCCGCFAFVFKRITDNKVGYDSSSSDSDYEHAMHHPPPMAYVTPQPMQPPGMNPYYDPRLVGPQSIQPMPMPMHSMSSMGSNSPGNADGFMSTMAPNGQSWMSYCSAQQVFVDPSSGFIAGAWGEAVAWATVYENQNPGWEQDPRMRGGPVGHVIQAMVDHSPEHMQGEVEAAGERLEEACKDAMRRNVPLPIINERA